MYPITVYRKLPELCLAYSKRNKKERKSPTGTCNWAGEGTEKKLTCF